jgi:hypothetical protein
VSRLQRDLDEATRKAHDVELQLARAQTLLENLEGRPSQPRSSASGESREAS